MEGGIGCVVGFILAVLLLFAFFKHLDKQSRG